MKKVLLLSLQFLLIIGCGKSIDESALLQRNGIKYLPNSEDPYSGQVFSLYENGQKEMEGTYKDGMKDRLWTEWWDNGQKKEEGTYKNGIGDGLIKFWYENGQKEMEGTYKDGMKDRLWTEWWDNGQKKEEGTYKNGIGDGLIKFWYENGQRKYVIKTLTTEQIETIMEEVSGMHLPTIEPDELAVLETTFGNLVIEFDLENAPVHAANFKKLVMAGYYDGVSLTCPLS